MREIQPGPNPGGPSGDFGRTLSRRDRCLRRADGYPDRTVKIIVPFPAGGTADLLPRAVADRLSRKWGQPVVIENRTGAAGNIGAEQAYRSAPDGYTLLASPPPPLVINQNLYRNLAFDPLRFEPIIVMAKVPNALLVNPDKVKSSNLSELINDLKTNPDRMTVATQGNGTTSHLTSELFQLMAKVKLRQIPYRGSAPALQGLLAGDVDLMFDNLGVSLPLVASGKLRRFDLPRFRTCQPWPRCCRASKRSRGTASSRLRIPLGTLSTRSMQM